MNHWYRLVINIALLWNDHLMAGLAADPLHCTYLPFASRSSLHRGFKSAQPTICRNVHIDIYVAGLADRENREIYTSLFKRLTYREAHTDTTETKSNRNITLSDVPLRHYIAESTPRLRKREPFHLQ